MKRAQIKAIDSFVIPVSEKTNWIMLEIRTDDGLSGYGEATFAGAEEAVLAEIGHARALIVDKSLAIPGEVLAAVQLAHMPEARRIVAAALEQACLDTLARRAGVSLAEMLGGPAHRDVAVYANINRGIPDRSPAGFAARARTVVEEDGYTAVKIAPFDALHWARSDAATGARLLASGIERIVAVRTAVGDEIGLLVDCHSRLSPVMARAVLREVEDLHLFWLEEPLHEQAFDQTAARALRSYANDRGVRIAGGEQLTSMIEARAFLARGGCDAILPDLRYTGLRAGMSILELAAACGVESSLHNPVGPILDLVSLQVAAALPAFLILERQVRESPLFDQICGGPMPLVDGRLALPGDAGIGATPDRATMARLAVIQVRRSATFAGMQGAGPNA